MTSLSALWLPILLSWELPEPDCPPVRVRCLGEKLILMFQDRQARLGQIWRIQ